MGTLRPPHDGKHGDFDAGQGSRLEVASLSTDPPEIAGSEGVLLARVISGEGVSAEQMLDRETLADLVHEAIEHSQRVRGVAAQTTWWDATEAADLILFHVTQLASAAEPPLSVAAANLHAPVNRPSRAPAGNPDSIEAGNTGRLDQNHTGQSADHPYVAAADSGDQAGLH